MIYDIITHRNQKISKCEKNETGTEKKWENNEMGKQNELHRKKIKTHRDETVCGGIYLPINLIFQKWST